MRKLLWVLAILLVAPLIAAVVVASMIFERQPLVNRDAEFTPEHVARAHRILERNNPIKLRPGDVRTVTLDQPDVDLAANFIAHLYAHGSARVVLQPGTLHVGLSSRLAHNPFGDYLNVDATLGEASGVPRVQYLRIGSLEVPGSLADSALRRMLPLLLRDEDVRLAAGMIRDLKVDDGRLSVRYEWPEGAPARLQAAAVPPDEQERLRLYQARLAEASRRAPDAGRSTSIVDLMRPLFELAAERSAAGDAVAENRAAIVVLAFHVTGQDLATVLAPAKDWPRAGKAVVTLNGRDDFPKHFLVSAALSAHAGKSLANAIGLYKEIDDSRGGSGFSFNDIAADGAGTRFGELATGGADTARKLQQRMAAGAAEADLMPATADLPEFMPEAEFVRRFGGEGAPEYVRMTEEIERRIAALPINR